MADVRVYDGVKNPMQQRELIGTIKPVTIPAKEGKAEQKGYVAALQLNADDERTKKATELNPSGGAQLHLASAYFKGRDGKNHLGHGRFYTEEQGNKMIEAAGKNVAQAKGQDGKNLPDTKVIAFKADLVTSKNGLAVNTAKEMKPSELADFGKSAPKADKAMSRQFEAMSEASARAKEAKAAAKDVQAEAPAAEQEKVADMEVGG